jgi:hypothetical protein
MTDIDWSQLNLAAMWRDWVVKSEAQWSDTVSKMLKDEHSGPLLNKQVDEARMMHRMFSEMAQASLAAANLPSRSDFEALDERLGRVEDGLASVSAELVRLRSALVSSGAAAPTRSKPPRTRKPVRKAASKE